MLSAWNRDAPKRWPRGQKFSLTETGATAEAAYRDTVASSRSSGRAVLDGALAAWAGPLGLAPKDGIVLAELRGRRAGVAELAADLEEADFAPDDVRTAIGRLVDAAMIEPLASPAQG